MPNILSTPEECAALVDELVMQLDYLRVALLATEKHRLPHLAGTLKHVARQCMWTRETLESLQREAQP